MGYRIHKIGMIDRIGENLGFSEESGTPSFEIMNPQRLSKSGVGPARGGRGFPGMTFLKRKKPDPWRGIGP